MNSIVHEHSELTSAAQSVVADSYSRNKILCHHCDLLLELPPLREGERATCPRCDTVLTRKRAHVHLIPVMYAGCALFMLFLALIFPFINFRVAGNFSQVGLSEIPGALADDNYLSLGILFLIFVQLIPLFCMSSIIVLCLKLPVSKALRRVLCRWLFLLKPWCMVEIFLVGVLISFVKLIMYGDIGLGLAFFPYCLFCLLQIKAFQTVDKRWLWLQVAPLPRIDRIMRVGETGAMQGLRLCQCCKAILDAEKRVCPRCQTKGALRRHNSLQWTMALLITSALLYIPANILPIMTTFSLTSNLSSTILSGVIVLWQEGSYPIAVIIFAASILIPTLKIIAIAWLCLYAQGKGGGQSEQMFAMYEVVEFVGRWSMIDIFVIAVLATLVRMGNLMGVDPEIGAIFFAAVVILTMISSAMFDPRLIWDRTPVAMKREGNSAAN